MCYDIKANLEAQLSRANWKGDLHAIEEIKEKLVPLTDLPIYHTTGFNHPKWLIYTDRSPWYPEVSTWGLVPHWVMDKEQLQELWNKTLNARVETIFEKPSFRESANTTVVSSLSTDFMNTTILMEKHFRSTSTKKTTSLCHWQDFGANGSIQQQGRPSTLFP